MSAFGTLNKQQEVNLFQKLIGNYLSVIFGDPKCGKSVFCLMIVEAIVRWQDMFTGQALPGEDPQRPVLYCATEDTEEEIRETLRDQRGFTKEEMERVIIMDETRFDDNYERNREKMLRCAVNGNCINAILDIAIIFHSAKDSYHATYRNMNRFKQYKRDINCGFIMTRHTNKSRGEYWESRVMGSQAHIAAPDTALYVERDRVTNHGLLCGMFRKKMDNVELNTKLDREAGVWNLVDKLHLTQKERTFAELLDEKPSGCSIKDLAPYCGSLNSARNILNRMMNEKGVVTKKGNGLWFLTQTGFDLLKP